VDRHNLHHPRLSFRLGVRSITHVRCVPQPTITFAAQDSPTCDTGLFVPALDRPISKLEFASGHVYVQESLHNDTAKGLSGYLNHQALFLRGWTLQETVLSRRILWCAVSELQWSCGNKQVCECDLTAIGSKTDMSMLYQAGLMPTKKGRDLLRFGFRE
jgi:hypothetical protein